MSIELNLKRLQQTLDPELSFFSSADIASLPPMWQGYLSSTDLERLQFLRVEMRDMADYFPETARRLAHIACDVFLAQSPRLGVCRFVTIALEGETYFRYSRCPLAYAPATNDPLVELIRQRAPDALAYTYFQMMDGLTDPFDFVGFKNSLALTTVEAEIDTYADLPFFDRVKALGDLNNVVELLASGGGGYLLIDLNRDMRGDSDPVGFRISKNASDQWSPDTPVPLFAMLDAWMAVGLGQTGPT